MRLLSRWGSGEAPTTAQVRIASTLRMASSTGAEGNVRARLRWAIVPITGVVAAGPVILSAIRALANDWTPVGDRAVIATRAFDVLSTHPPLLGQFSASSGVASENAHSLGPMLYWVLALPARVGGVAPAIAIAVVNVACVMGTVALARRRGGFWLMAA